MLALHQAGVDLHQVHGDQVARLVDALSDVVTLTQCQAAADGSACAGSPLGVKGVDVKAEVDGGVVANVGERHLHNAADAMSVGQVLAVVHTGIKRGTDLSMSNMLNALMPFSLSILFSPASTSRRPIYTSFCSDRRFDSSSQPKYSSLSSFASPVRKATGMPWILPEPDVSGVLISAWASTQMTATSRLSLSRMAFAVPPTHEAALAGVAVDLVCNAAGDGGDGLGVLHAAVRRVVASLGHQVGVQVDGVVAMQLVAQLIAQLVIWGLCAYLSTREANSYHTQVLWVGQELGLNHASVETLVVVVVAVGDASLALLVGAAVAVASRGGSAVFEGWRDHDGCVEGMDGVVVRSFMEGGRAAVARESDVRTLLRRNLGSSGVTASAWRQARREEVDKKRARTWSCSWN
ncbi:hypothetical protein FJTKL_12869 [Diaporthe vaccinii]|uniref:Uncharacterized protein n=1 Tax=Diaporthe vaccinii TaxID=105482 RepID=A0ABR4F9W6_9PEZI